MSPTNSSFHGDHEHARIREINGPRPSPLKINKASNLIHKPSSNISDLKSSIKQPVIIYIHSPKIIHTRARDFMALVQKLTGLSSPGQPRHLSPSPDQNDRKRSAGIDDADSCSGLTDENICDVKSMDLFCSPKVIYRSSCPDSAVSPNMASLMSPSFMEFLKGLPD